MAATPLADRAAPAVGALPEPCVLLKLGEVVLKGGNRQQFERMLQANIRRAIHELGTAVRLWQRDGVIVIRIAEAQRGPPRHPRPTGSPSVPATSWASPVSAGRCGSRRTLTPRSRRRSR